MAAGGPEEGTRTFSLSPRAVLRIASWPLETLELHADPHLTAAALELADQIRRCRAEADELAALLFRLVPLEGDRLRRGRLLELRRAVRRDLTPLPADLLSSCSRAESERHQLTRFELRRSSEAFRADHASAVAATWAAILGQLTDGRFLLALTVANDGLADRWIRYTTDPPIRRQARHRRLERTALSYLLRACGRCTPQGLWAGVSTVEPGGRSAAWDLTPTVERHRVGFDPAVVLPVIRAWGSPPQPRLGLPYRLRALPSANGPLVQLLVDAFGDGQAKPVAQFAELVAAGDPGLRQAVATTAESLIAEGALDVLPPLDTAAQDPWALLSPLARMLDGEDRAAFVRWEDAVRTAVDEMARALTTSDRTLAASAHRRARAATRDLWATAGVDGEPPPCLVVDLRIGWRATWGTEERSLVAEALGELWALHRLDGAAEEFRRESVRELLAGSSERPAAEVAARLPGPRPPPGRSRQALFSRFGEPPVRPAGSRGLAGALASRWHEAEVVIDVARSSAERAAPGPWGDQLFTLGADGRLIATWGRPQPGLFRHRFTPLLGRDEDARRLVTRRGHAAGRVAASIRPSTAPNPGALIGTPLLARTVRGSDVPGGRVVAGRDGIEVLLRLADGREVVPVHSSAALIGVDDAFDRLLYRTAMALGWELLGHGVPELDEERRAGGRPRLVLPSGSVASARRWVVEAGEVAQLAGLDPPDRFLRWATLVQGLGLPALVWVERADVPGDERLPLRVDSPVHVEWLFATSEGALLLTEGPGPAERLPVAGPRGHHLAELGVTWVEDPR